MSLFDDDDFDAIPSYDDSDSDSDDSEEAQEEAEAAPTPAPVAAAELTAEPAAAVDPKAAARAKARAAAAARSKANAKGAPVAPAPAAAAAAAPAGANVADSGKTAQEVAREKAKARIAAKRAAAAVAPAEGVPPTGNLEAKVSAAAEANQAKAVAADEIKKKAAEEGRAAKAAQRAEAAAKRKEEAAATKAKQDEAKKERAAMLAAMAAEAEAQLAATDGEEDLSKLSGADKFLAKKQAAAADVERKRAEELEAAKHLLENSDEDQPAPAHTPAPEPPVAGPAPAESGHKAAEVKSSEDAKAAKIAAAAELAKQRLAERREKEEAKKAAQARAAEEAKAAAAAAAEAEAQAIIDREQSAAAARAAAKEAEAAAARAKREAAVAAAEAEYNSMLDTTQAASVPESNNAAATAGSKDDTGQVFDMRLSQFEAELDAASAMGATAGGETGGTDAGNLKAKAAAKREAAKAKVAAKVASKAATAQAKADALVPERDESPDGCLYDDSDPFGVEDDQDQDGSEIQLGSTGAVVPNKPTELSVSDNSMDIVWTMSGDLPDGGPDVLRFELSYGKSLAPVATWRLVPCTHRTDGYGDLMEYSTTLGGLTAGTTLAVRLRVIYDGKTSEWSEKSDPIQLAGEKVSLASAASEKLKDGAVAKVASVAKVIPGAGSGVGLRGDAFMDAVVSITTNDDERPDPAVEEEVVQSLLTAAASDCKVLAAQVSTRLSVPDARVKIKTLQLILNCLTSKHRTVDSKFRPAIQASAQEFISSLQQFECEPDPQFGDKPRDIVRSSAAKITNMLMDRMSSVAPEGEVQIKARKKHESSLELPPGSAIHWEFRLHSKDIGFSAQFERETESGQVEQEQVVSYDKLYAEHGAVTGDFAPSGSYRRGKIKFEWDNSFSKLTAKTISFKLSYSTY